jgi:hypothetical protein
MIYRLMILSNPGTIVLILTLSLFGIKTAHGQKYNKVKLKHGHTAFSTRNGTLIMDLREHGSRAELIFFTDNCIVLGRGKKVDWLIASTDFDPRTIPRNLQKRFDRIQLVTLMKMKGNSNVRDTLTFLPSWLFGLSKLKGVEFNNFIVGGDAPIDQLKIVYLILKDCQIKDINDFINKVSKNEYLGVLIHRDIFSNEDIAKIEAQAPSIKVIPDTDAIIGIEQNGIEYTIRMPN